MSVFRVQEQEEQLKHVPCSDPGREAIVTAITAGGHPPRVSPFTEEGEAVSHCFCVPYPVQGNTVVPEAEPATVLGGLGPKM